MAEELEITRLRLKDDFDFYARNCLYIRSKSGDVKAFTMNRAQQYVHACIEEQRAKTGKVRAIILKAGSRAYRRTQKPGITGR